MTEYYDLVLGLIPLALVGVTAGLSAAGVALTTAVTLAGVLSVLLVGHAMFVNGPVDGQSGAGSTSSASFEPAD